MKVITPVLPRRGQATRAKPANHPAIDEVVMFASRRVFALAREDLEIVAVIGRLYVRSTFSPGV